MADNCMRSRVVGFTLIELMVTIAVVAIVMMIAAPSFQSFTANQRVRSTAAELLSTMNFARSEAVKRNTSIKVERDSNWVNGWEVKRGSDTLMDYGAQGSVSITASPASTDLTYGTNGRLTGNNSFSFEVAPNPTVSGVQSRCVRVTLSGKPTVSQGACS